MSDKADYKTLCKTTVGEELSEAECQVLAEKMGVRKLHNDELLIKEGEADNTLFILTEGKLAVTGNVLGNEVVVYTKRMKGGFETRKQNFIIVASLDNPKT